MNFLMLVSETPNKSRPFGFAATKRRSQFVTTIASGELTSNVCKSFSLARSASCSLRGLLATLLPNLKTMFCACRRCIATCPNPINSSLVILAFVATIASRDIATNFRKGLLLPRSASSSLRVLATLLPQYGERLLTKMYPSSAPVQQTLVILIWRRPERGPGTIRSKSQNLFTEGTQLNQGMNLAETVKIARAGLLA